jgi:hypothetical protein
MVRLAALALLLCRLVLAAAVPTPKEHFSFTPGDDNQIAGYQQISAYFHKLAAASDRIRVEEFGTSSEGRPMLVAYISSAANLRHLDHWKQINRRLALGQAAPEEARQLAAEGKAIVWIDSGLHATEVAPAQHSPELAYRMVSGETAEIRRIREDVILVQVPVINPDGLDAVAEWQRRNLGTPFELAPLPVLYQKYAGHDNNRDWFMLNLAETRNVSRLLFSEWFPQIVYNQHQAPAFPARIFVPPYAEPLNPDIPAPVMEGINLIGAAMKERFARENKTGVVSYFGFDAWWNGGLRSAPAFHNMHGILTETAGFGYGTPRVYKPSELPERFSNGVSTKEPSVFYERPWPGGRWGLNDAVEYMLTADFAILDLASARREHLLTKAWEMARANIEAGQRGKPFAYVVPTDQWDASAAADMLRRLQLAGIEVRQAQAAFKANGKSYPAGTLLLPAAQPFRGYLIDLMEPQKYPDLRSSPTSPPKRPYDLAGWTLPFQMGVAVERIDEPFDAALDPVPQIEMPAPAPDPHQNSSYLAIAAALDKGESATLAGRTIHRPRVALYQPALANSDTGWTEWLLDSYKIRHTKLENVEARKGALREKYDVVILAAQSMQSILNGSRPGEDAGGRRREASEDPVSPQRPEFTGGIGLEGAMALLDFVRQGGTLLAFDTATELPLQLFGLGVRGLVGEGGDYYCPGSVLNIDVDDASPIASGMPKQAHATSTGGQAFEIMLLPEFNQGERLTRAVAWYAKKDVLASGWLSGERVIAGRPAVVEAAVGQGRVVLYGFHPQFRGQSAGTFKLVLNAIYLSGR